MTADEYVPSDQGMEDRYVGFSLDRMDFPNDDMRKWAERLREEFRRGLARVRRDAQREAAQMIRDACDRWEVDGDDERLVNDVLAPWTSRVLNPEENPRD